MDERWFTITLKAVPGHPTYGITHDFIHKSFESGKITALPLRPDDHRTLDELIQCYRLTGTVNHETSTLAMELPMTTAPEVQASRRINSYMLTSIPDDKPMKLKVHDPNPTFRAIVMNSNVVFVCLEEVDTKQEYEETFILLLSGSLVPAQHEYCASFMYPLGQRTYHLFRSRLPRA